MPLGRLSGITAHWVPSYLQRNRMPSWETNLMEDWEAKVDRIVEETMAQVHEITQWNPILDADVF